MQLRECPFCGRYDLIMVRVSDIERAIRCVNCGANGPQISTYGEHSPDDNQDATREGWNRRASDSQRCGSCRWHGENAGTCWNQVAPVSIRYGRTPADFGCVLWEKA